MTADVTMSLERLRDELRGVRLGLELPDAAHARRVRDDLVAQVDDYLLPRLRQMEAPALIAVVAGTGAGKPPVVISRTCPVVSPAGLLRPTTRVPVLACSPA